jgi:hypothetical protein
LLALRSRPAGGGFKPPSGASLKRRGAEHDGQGGLSVHQVRTRKANVCEPPLTCRKRSDGIKTEVESLPRDEPGGYLPTAQVVPGIKVARAWFRLWCGTREGVAPNVATGLRSCPARSSKGEPRAAGTARGRVPTRGTLTDCPVVAMRPGNAGGAKGAAHPGLFGGQLW